VDATTEITKVERELAIAASPETVWEFLVDPEKTTRWMGQRATLAARPGGLYRCEVIPGHTAVGEFVVLDRPHRLVFTWGWENETEVPPGSSTVEIELTSDGDGTILHFVHHDLPNTKSAESHSHGWGHYLPRLAVAAAGGDPGEDPWLTRPMGAEA